MKLNAPFTKWLSGLALLFAVAAQAEKENPKAAQPQKESVCAGVLSALDEKENTVTVRWIVFKKTFNLGKDCVLVVANKSHPKFADLRLGEDVEVRYRDVEGVAVAHRVAQMEPMLIGVIEAVDQKARTVTVKKSPTVKTFKLAEDCRVVLMKNGTGKLDDLKAGQKVAVTHGKDKTALVATRIEQQGEEFSGIIRAIDVQARTFKAQSLLTTRKFNLGRDCVIALEDKEKAKLADLRIGQSVKVAYEEADGVYIAHHLEATEVAEKRASEDTGPQ